MSGPLTGRNQGVDFNGVDVPQPDPGRLPAAVQLIA